MDFRTVEAFKEKICSNDIKTAQLLEYIFELMNEGSYDAKNILFDIAKNHNCELVRHETIFAIGEMGCDDEIRDFLKERVIKDSSIIVQHECLVVLGIIGKIEDINFLQQYVNHNTIEVRASAQIGIDRINQKENFEEEVLFHQEENRNRLLDTSNTTQNDRIQILFQLMKHSSEENVNAISQCFLNDSCPIVRHEAGFVLGEMNTDLALFALIEGIVKQKEPIAIHEALFALGTTGDSRALDVINSFLDNPNYIISQSAVIAKEKIEIVKNPYRGING